MKLVLLIFIFINSLSASDFDKTARGTSSAQFLKIITSPRASAMGEAQGADIKDASAIDINPACLVGINKKSIFISHSQYFADTSLEFLAYSSNLGEEIGSWGFSFKYFNWGKLDATDEGGEKISNVNPYDISAGVSFATYISGFNKDVEERFVFGATGKIVRSKITGADNTVSTDIGLLTPFMFENKFRMSLTLQNLLGKLKLDKESSTLPFLVRLGSVVYINKYSTITADIVAPRDSFLYLAMGTELAIKATKNTAIYLRGGFNTRNILDISGFKNITAGFGLSYKEYYWDYSFTPYGELGNIHRISFSLNY